MDDVVAYAAASNPSEEAFDNTGGEIIGEKESWIPIDQSDNTGNVEGLRKRKGLKEALSDSDKLEKDPEVRTKKGKGKLALNKARTPKSSPDKKSEDDEAKNDETPNIGLLSDLEKVVQFVRNIVIPTEETENDDERVAAFVVIADERDYSYLYFDEEHFHIKREDFPPGARTLEAIMKVDTVAKLSSTALELHKYFLNKQNFMLLRLYKFTSTEIALLLDWIPYFIQIIRKIRSDNVPEFAVKQMDRMDVYFSSWVRWTDCTIARLILFFLRLVPILTIPILEMPGEATTVFIRKAKSVKNKTFKIASKIWSKILCVSPIASKGG